MKNPKPNGGGAEGDVCFIGLKERKKNEIGWGREGKGEGQVSLSTCNMKKNDKSRST